MQPLHPHRDMARVAIKALTASGNEVHIVPQNLIELGELGHTLSSIRKADA